MGIKEQPSLIHWNYFLALEQDLERLSRYVEFTADNFGTYSIEIVQIYLSACSEVDVVSKLLAKRIDENVSPNNIGEYREIIRPVIPSLCTDVVSLSRNSLELNPWDSWGKDESPFWWRHHNDVKHERNAHFDKANLKNVLNAVAGLFVLVLYYYKGQENCERLEPIPSLFNPPANLAKVCPTIGGRMCVFYGT